MKKYKKYLIILLFFIILLFLSPISGDDWGNYLVGKEGIRHSLGVALGMYFDWEGRLISRVFLNILTYNKWLWNILNAILITSTIYIGMKFTGQKPKKTIFPLMILVILLMNIYTFSQTITWLAGNMTYFFITPVILWYFYNLLNKENCNKLTTTIFVLINTFGTMFVENMALVIIIGNVLVILYKYIKNKKIDKKIIVYTLISIITTTTMLLSPGTRFRNSIENIEFNNLNFIEKIISNVTNLINYTYIYNPYLLVLSTYANYQIIKHKIKKKFLKLMLMLFILIIPISTIVAYPITLFKMTNLYMIINSTNIFIIIYWLLYLILTFILLLIENIKDLKQVVLFIIGIVSNIVMLVSPTWGFRTSLFTYIVLSIIALNIINRYLKENKIINITSYSLVVITSLFYLIFYINIYRCQKNIENSIQTQLSNNEQIIYIDAMPGYANCNINPTNDFHKKLFKNYYNIPQQTEIKINQGKWKYLIFYNN